MVLLRQDGGLPIAAWFTGTVLRQGHAPLLRLAVRAASSNEGSQCDRIVCPLVIYFRPSIRALAFTAHARNGPRNRFNLILAGHTRRGLSSAQSALDTNQSASPWSPRPYSAQHLVFFATNLLYLAVAPIGNTLWCAQWRVDIETKWQQLGQI